ncbi:hypothetical protein K7B10_24915 [Streptomyces flavotricini]|uniref:Ribbon-helix-helix protein CopG domain-containing protein n=1 Tax=Streptomyces flavotricini TaxID=66888 RepID=A0ABS8EBS2_9ACTN|nr:hypothetical protein [Streptomyces flavotricini]MCC0097957.1 hypothetical protein [Streptomyces flavotricini]
MESLIIRLEGGDRAELADLADASGRAPEDLARDAVLRYLRDERVRVGAEAARLAQRHAALLKRLGQ